MNDRSLRKSAWNRFPRHPAGAWACAIGAATPSAPITPATTTARLIASPTDPRPAREGIRSTGDRIRACSNAIRQLNGLQPGRPMHRLAHLATLQQDLTR